MAQALDPEGKSLEDEEYREVKGPDGRWYLIINPMRLWVGETTHRVLDKDGIVHCYPKNTIIRWKPKTGRNPVAF